MMSNKLGSLSLLLTLSLWSANTSQGAEVLSRGPDQEGLNERIWSIPESSSLDQLTEPRVGLPGEIVDPPSSVRVKGRVMEVATGMNYFDGERLKPSVATFTEGESGFLANQTQHKVSIRRNLLTQSAVTLVSRDGISLKSTPAAICLYDTESGVSMIIGTVAESVGVLASSNRIVYPNAFKGVCADVVYTIGRATFEQDVVIAERLDPNDYGFPPETTQVQIFTEIFDLQEEPERIRRPIRVEEDLAKRQQMDSPDMVDEVLGFGEVVLATGRAATVEKMAGSDYGGVPVAKKLVTVEGRRFLVESLDYSSLKSEFLDLPECNSDNAALEPKLQPIPKKGYASLPAIPFKSTTDRGTQTLVARVDPAALLRTKGVVVDYLATVGSSLSSGFVFQGDTTYLVTGPVICNGSLTIEGGAVIKYKRNASASLKIIGSLSCKTSMYKPAFFTAVDDDSLGESMSGSANSGYVGPTQVASSYYANPALWFSYAGSHTLTHLRFRYCEEAVRFEGPVANFELWHSQWVKCVRGIVITGSGSGSDGTLAVNNNLFSNVHNPLRVEAGSCTQAFYNSTIDNTDSVAATTLVTSTASATCSFYNSLLVNITTLNVGTVSLSASDYNGFYSTPVFGGAVNRWSASSHPFVVGLSGKNYLRPGGIFTDRSTTAVLPPGLAADLARMTTAVPLTLAPTISVPTTLSASGGVPRDAGLLDLGYHYPAIDWVLNQVTLSAKLEIVGGASIALQGTHGLSILPGGGVSWEGLPSRLAAIASLANVQEQPDSVINSKFITLGSDSGLPLLDFRFTDFSLGQGTRATILDVGTLYNFPVASLTFKDSRLRCISMTLSPQATTPVTIGFTNNILERCFLDLRRSGPSIDTPMSVYLYNNLFHCLNANSETALKLNYVVGTADPGWVVRDSLFDKVGQKLEGSANAPVTLSNNGFTSTQDPSFVGAGDQTGISFTFQTGPLGEFYVPNNTHTQAKIIGRGSRLATAAGLAHHTILSALNTKENTTQVDIGFHYVGVNTSQQPIDTDGDGLTDVTEDLNGDLVYGAGDLCNWQITDTDGDQIPDGVEVQRKLNPTARQTDFVLGFPVRF